MPGTALEPLPRVLLSVRETAEALGVSRPIVDALIADGSLPCVRIGRRRLIRVTTLLAWVEAQEAGGAEGVAG